MVPIVLDGSAPDLRSEGFTKIQGRNPDTEQNETVSC